jgi:hypothetical protein
MQMEDLDEEPEEPQLSITVAVLTLMINELTAITQKKNGSTTDPGET